MVHSPRPSLTRVILPSNDGTVVDREEFCDVATQNGCMIADAFEFARNEVNSARDLTDVDAVVAALGRAIAGRMDIWLPFPRSDFANEQHVRRLILVLQRHGLNLLSGRTVHPCPTDDGAYSEIDYALRREVRAVDALDHAALAAAGAKTLGSEIERALSVAIGAPTNWQVRSDEGTTYLEGCTTALLPPPTAPWPQRQPLLKRYTQWLVHECGVTQVATARVLNSTGQRTATGREWQPGTVSKLLNGHGDHAACGG